MFHVIARVFLPKQSPAESESVRRKERGSQRHNRRTIPGSHFYPPNSIDERSNAVTSLTAFFTSLKSTISDGV